MNYEVKIHAPKNLNEKWYVYIYSEGKILKKFYKGLAKEDNYNDRMLKAEVLKSIVEKEIKMGWKPSSPKLPQPYQVNLTAVEAYNKAWEIIETANLAPKTKSDYRTHYNFFIQALSRLKWENALFSDLDAFHFTKILEEMSVMRGRGNVFYNKHLLICKSFSKFLKQQFLIKENKVLGIPEKEHKAKEKRLLTAEEQTRIIKHFKGFLPQFITYLKVIYHTSIRPQEILRIKCGMIDTERWMFILPEDITKNGKKGYLLIPNDLKEDLERLDLSNPNYYLFGILKTRSRDRKKTFLPSPFRLSVNTANKLWKEEVKQKLGIPSDMYWLKSKSSNDKMRNGMSLEAVRIANRHSDKEITKIYATESDIITLEQNLDKFGKFE